jgi:hypothetical protein
MMTGRVIDNRNIVETSSRGGNDRVPANFCRVLDFAHVEEWTMGNSE